MILSESVLRRDVRALILAEVLHMDVTSRGGECQIAVFLRSGIPLTLLFFCQSGIGKRIPSARMW